MGDFFIVGGAGYIGSHVVKELVKRGHEVVVLDDLSTGHRGAVKGSTDYADYADYAEIKDKSGEFIKGDLGDRQLLGRIFSSRKIDCVMHFAASCLVGESVEHPLSYYHNNMAKTTHLFNGHERTRGE